MVHEPSLKHLFFLTHPKVSSWDNQTFFADLFPSAATQTAVLTLKTSGNKQLGTRDGGIVTA